MTDLNTLSVGKGEPIIFIPGWSMTIDCFVKQVDYFQQYFQCIVYDPRSQGDSPKSANNTNLQRGKDLNDVIQHYQIDQVHLVGWSDGYFAICSYLEQFGFDHVHSICNIDRPIKGIKQKADDYTFGDFDSEKQVYFSVLQDQKGFLQSFLSHMLRDDHAAIEPFLNNALKTPCYAAAQFIADDCFQDFSDITKQAAASKPFCHFIATSREERGLAWSNNNTPQAETHVFGNHMMFWLEPEKFNGCLHNFLR